MFAYDHDFRSCQNQRKPEFYEYFQKAFDNYIDGDWLNASSNLVVAGQLVKDDGPSNWMSSYIEKNKSLAPEDWAGARNIDQKEKAPEIHFLREDEDFEGQDQDIGTETAMSGAI